MSSDDAIRGFLCGMGLTLILFFFIGLIINGPTKEYKEGGELYIGYVLSGPTPVSQERISLPENVGVNISEVVLEANETGG